MGGVLWISGESDKLRPGMLDDRSVISTAAWKAKNNLVWCVWTWDVFAALDGAKSEPKNLPFPGFFSLVFLFPNLVPNMETFFTTAQTLYFRPSLIIRCPT